jgi:hypothetical protein
MQVTIQQVSDVKVGQYGPSCKIHTTSGDYFVNEDATPLLGKTVEAEVTEKTSKSGNKYKVAKIIKVIEAAAAQQNGNGKITWDSYRAMAEAAHELAAKLEPDRHTGLNDTEPTLIVDRSQARASILNTVMIAYSNGKIFVPEIDDDMPF